MKRRLFALVSFLLVFPACDQAVDYQVHIFGITEGDTVDSDSVGLTFIVTPDDWVEKGYTVHFLLDREHLQIARDKSGVSYAGLTPGGHAITALVCDPAGIALRNPGSISIRNFYSRRVTEPLLKTNRPLLITHMPQDTLFSGAASARILLDMRVLNAEMGAGYRIRYNLNGQDYFLERDAPVWLENANRIGRHTLEISLETTSGSPVIDNPYNQITKRFLVRE